MEVAVEEGGVEGNEEDEKEKDDELFSSSGVVNTAVVLFSSSGVVNTAVVGPDRPDGAVGSEGAEPGRRPEKGL